MKLKMTKRAGSKKSESGQIRREGNIPAIIYGSKEANETVTVDGVEFRAVLRSIKQGRLSTTRFTLTDGKDQIEAIVKDVQYHPTTYEILHLDFEKLIPNKPINVKVPVEFTGVADCTGIKLGGFLRPVVRQLKVSCTPEKMPEFFSIDVKELLIGQSARLSSIEIPEGVKSLISLKEVAVVIAKR